MKLALTHDDGTMIAAVPIDADRWVWAIVDDSEARVLLGKLDAAITGDSPLATLAADECATCGTPIKQGPHPDEVDGYGERVWLDRLGEPFALTGQAEVFHFHHPTQRGSVG